MELNRISHARPMATNATVRSTANKTTQEALPSDGFQSGTLDALPGKPVLATAVSTTVNFPAVDANGFQTLVLGLADGSKERSLNYDLTDGLEEIAKKDRKEFQILPTNEGPAGLFSSELILRVHESKMDLLQQAMTEHPGAAVLNTADVLNSEPTAVSKVSPEMLATLESGSFSARAGVTRSIARLMNSPSAPALDETTRNTLADGVLKTGGGMMNLFNATLTAETADRRKELLDEQKQAAAKQETAGQIFEGHFNASEAAKKELWAKGGTPALGRMAELATESFTLLGKLDTERAHAFRSQMLTQLDGALLTEVASNPAQAEKMADHMVGVVGDRLGQTEKFLAMAKSELPKTARGVRSSGGFSHLPGEQSNMSLFERTPNFPYSDAPTGALALLGTEQSGMVKDKLKELFLKADAGLPALQADHRQHEIGDKLAGVEARIQDEVKAWPEARKSVLVPQMVAAETKAIEDGYEGLTAQADVRHLAESLAYLNISQGSAFSSGRAQSEAATLVADLLPQLQSKEMHKMFTDIGLSVWDRSSDATPEARGALLKALSGPGADGEARLGAATRLMTQGELGMLPTVVEGLSHANSDIRSQAIEALGVATAVTHDRPVGNADGLVKALASPMSRIQFQASLGSSTPVLETLLQDQDSVWIRTHAAKVLADLGSSSPAALASMTSLLADDGATVKYGGVVSSLKNATARSTAAEMLGHFGSRAASAAPELKAQVQLAEQARSALALVDQQRQQASGKPFEPQSDPASREAMGTALKGGDGASFKRALAFLEDPKSPRAEDLPSYGRDNYPLAEAALREAVQVGEAAAKALAKIEAK